MAKNENKAKAKKPVNTVYASVKSRPVETVRALVEDSNNILTARTEVWDRYRRKYRRGLYYLANTGGQNVYFTNYIYSNIETVKATLTRNLPFISVIPRGEKDDLASDIMSRVLEDVTEKGELKKAIRGMVHNGLLSSMGFVKTYFDVNKNKVVHESVMPDNMLIDPLAQTLDDPRWIIQKRCAVPVDEIFAEYGVVPAQDVKAGKDRLYDTDDIRMTYDVGVYSEQKQNSTQIGEVFDVYEAWIRCWDEDRENDWYIVTIAGNSVLRQEFSVYEHNKTPFDVWFCVEDESADNIYYRGVGGVEEIEPLQDRADAIDFKVMKHLNLMTNRQRYVSVQSGLNGNTIDNTAGRVYMVNGDPSKTVYYDVPPSLNQEIYQYRDQTEPAMQTVSGVFDVMQGRRPTGITAGSAIRALKDSAETRTGYMSDSVGNVIQKICDKTLQIIFQMYDDDMLLKASDADEDQMYVVVADYPPELQPQPTPMVDEMGEFMVGEDGGFVFDDEEELEVDEALQEQRDAWKEQNNIALVLSEVTYEWDVKVDTDSALPAVKAERGQIASDLFRLGAIDRKAVLDTMDFPNRRKVLSRIEAEVTGKNAGDPNAEAGLGAVDTLMATFEQALTQSGAPPEVIQQIMQAVMMAQQQENASDVATGNGTFPPQMA